ncbi:ADOP family duplicated permease [Gemmatimonadota bacterium Y43]|uniref:ABC transporter permease n=1 Tax=Gaopeijia maritima TaxID=3119007 RepID=UPI00328EA699
MARSRIGGAGVKLPRWVRFAVGRAVPPGARRDALLGDLLEEFAHRAEASGVHAARRWLRRETLSVAAQLLRARWTDPDLRGAQHDFDRRHAFAGSGSGARTLPASRGSNRMDILVSNIRYALRRMVRSPFFTLTAIVSLGLGIGANTAIFSMVNAVYLQDRGFADEASLVDVFTSSPDFTYGSFSYPDWEDVEAGTTDVFASIGTMRLSFAQIEADDGSIEMVFAEAVSGGWFETLGLRTVLGRGLGAEDHVAPGAHPVVVLSHAAWQSRYAGDPAVVGRTIRVGGLLHEVVGVLAPEYRGALTGLHPEVMIPILQFDEITGLSGDTFEARGNQSQFVKARLRPGVEAPQVEGALAQVVQQNRTAHPNYWTADRSLIVVPTADIVLHPMVDGYLTQATGVLMLVVAMVLLIACANLASFLLARASERRKEIAVRLAMGAKRRTLIGQLLTETLILAVLGGAVGLAAASMGLDLLQRADLPLPIPITFDLAPDRTVLFFSLGVSVVAGVLFGLAPALQATNPALAPTLRDETAGGGRARGNALRNALVAGQVAVSVVLLVGAGLFLRSFSAMQRIDLGFDDGPGALVQVVAPATRYDAAARDRFWTELQGRVEALPGVDRAALISNVPLDQLNTTFGAVTVPGVEPEDGRPYHLIDDAEVSPGWIETMGHPLVAGRGFEASDSEHSQPVAVVNEAFAEFFYGTTDAVGRSFGQGDDEVSIVGVIENSKVRRMGEADRPWFLRPIQQRGSNYMWVLARGSAHSEALAAEIVRTAQSIDREIMIVEAKTMDRHLGAIRLGRVLGAQVIGAFAALALLLASIGLYGVVSFAVSKRAREVGIRMSLGAEAGQVVRMLTASGLKLVAVGTGVGLLLSVLLAQGLSRLLYGVPTMDVVTLAGVTLLIGTVSFVAAWVPARRVTRVNPVAALRSE